MIARVLTVLLALFAAHAGAAVAQGNPRYIQFQPSATKGALYAPDKGPAPKVAFLVVHRTANFMSLIATRELAQRGFMVLGMNPRSDNNEAAVNFEEIALDIKQGVEFLRSQPGVEKVILIGHSGGGPSTSFYQATAEKGLAYCQGPNKITQCTKELAGLPKADAMVLLDAHPGNTVNTMRSLNPAVTDESRPQVLDPALNPFLPANGFNPAGDSTYSKEFVEAYSRAQAARMMRLIDRAVALREDMKAGRHQPSDDEVFTVYHDRARLSDIATGVDCCTTRPQRLLRNDGSIVTQIIRSVRVSQPENAKADANLRGTAVLSVVSFLSANAIRARHSLDDIDWCSSNNSTPCAVAQTSVPILVTSMGGHYFIKDGEYIFDQAASKDKEFIVIEGAVHGMTPCVACSKVTGQSYDNATRNLFDYVANWTRVRFP